MNRSWLVEVWEGGEVIHVEDHVSQSAEVRHIRDAGGDSHQTGVWIGDTGVLVGNGHASQHGESVTVDGDVGDSACVELDFLENRIFVGNSGNLDGGVLSGPRVSGGDLEQVVAADGYAIDGPSEEDF